MQTFTMKLLYALLVLLGTVVPLSQLVPWLIEHGLDFTLLFEQAFGPDIAAFAWTAAVFTSDMTIEETVAEVERLLQ